MPSPRFVLALDQGTTSSRALLFDHAGQVRGMAQREFTQHFPRPGWVEHDPMELWKTQLAVARQVLREQHVGAEEIVAIGIANQRETTLLWDRRTGEPIAPAIVWQDRRTAEWCDALEAQGHGALLQQKTGLVIDAYFSGSKIRWLLDHVPGARAKADRGELAFGTIDSWLAYQLCGVHVTDVSNASRTMLFDLHRLEWDDALLALFDIPRALMPTVVSTSGLIGHTRSDLFGAPIRVAALAGDQQAAAFGQACHQPGMAKNTYGTGCFLLMHAGENGLVSQHRLLSTVGWRLDSAPGRIDYMLEGSIFMAGAIVQWLRDDLGVIAQASDVEGLAREVPDSGGVIMVPAFAGLGAPYWDPHARGSVLGMTRATTRAHLCRAALDCIAHQTADVLRVMEKDAGIVLKELRVDGGASNNDLLMQIQADLLGVPVVRPAIIETTALGAAYLAGLAVEFWASQSEIAEQWRRARTFLPEMGEDERATRALRWKKAVAHVRAWR